jgi:iron complex outermembrane receptor protein
VRDRIGGWRNAGPCAQQPSTERRINQGPDKNQALLGRTTLQHKARLLASGAMLLAATLATSANAQSRQASTAAAAAAATNTIEELVVTAEKREQNLQDVPIAISAFSSEKRDLVGINTIQDMTNFTPGLNYSSAVDRATVRGVGRLTNAHPIPVPVAVYDDGIYTTSTVTAGKTPIFTDRVEVLRGPQGTLYGRNSMGGAINVISKRPTEDLYSEVRLNIGNYGHTTLEAAISGPITEGLQFRLSGNWDKQRDGYFTNVVPGMPSEGNVVDTYYLEGQIQAKFGEHLDMWTKVDVSGWNNGSGGPGARAGYAPGPFNVAEFGVQFVSPGFACAPGGVVTNVVNLSPLGCTNPAASDPRKFAADTKQTVSLDETYAFASHWTYHFDKMDAKLVAGGLNYHYTLISDLDGGAVESLTIPLRPLSAGPPVATCAFVPGCTPLAIKPRYSSTYQEDYHNISTELSLASTGDSDLQWIGGLYWYKEGYKQPVFTTMHDQTQLDAPTFGNGPPAFQRRLYDDRPEFEQESYAVYGQASYKFLDKFTATLGLRWNHDGLKGVETVRVLCFAITPCGTTPEVLGTLTPVIDITSALAYRGGIPMGVVDNGQPGGVTFTPDGFATRHYDASWEATTGTARLQWDPDHDTNIYASYSRGYLMGGVNSGIATSLGQFPFTDAEHIDDFEIGLKKNFGSRIQVNLDLFYEDLHGYQAPLTVVSNTGNLAVSQSRYLNIPKSTIKGVELEATWIPIDNLTIYGIYDFNDGTVDELSGIIDPTDPEAVAPGAKPLNPGPLQTCTGTTATSPVPNANPNPLCDVNTGLVQRPQDLSGAQLPQSPRNKLAINVTYSWQDVLGGSLTPSISYIWRDKQYSGLFTRPLGAAPSWDQWDGRITWKAKNNHLTIIAYVKNIGDTLGYDGGSTATRQIGVFAGSTLTALGINTPCTGGGSPCRGLPTSTPGTFSAVQGFTTSYALTPPRTYGVEFQYRF